ncbi:MAG: hypothetical protein IPN94_27790 [Sphingobacteriales bacterium]|nr:hypothetical protein [Sphingobacteriales bacterium]
MLLYCKYQRCPKCNKRNSSKNEPAKTITATGAVGASFTFYDNSQSVLAGPSTTNTYTPAAGNIGSLQPGVYTFYVSTTEVGKCESALVPVSYIIYDAPSAPNIVADQQYCVGQTIANLQVTGVQATNTITWYAEDPTVAGYTGTNVLVQGINLTTYATGLSNAAAVTEDYYVSQTVNGCESVAVPVTITVNANPNPSITGDLQLCAGESTTLDAGTGYSIYAWSTNQNSQTITTSTAGVYTVTVTNAAGCIANTSTTVIVNPLPVADAGADAVINCTNTTATLTATGGGTYAWSTTATTDAINVATAGTYTVTVTNTTTGCTDTDEVVVTEDNVPPTAGINPSTTTLTCANNSTATLTATGGGTYAWSTGETTAAINVTTVGTYTVTVTAANGCTDTEQVIINQDTTLPTVSITAPVTQLSCTVSSVTLEAEIAATNTLVWTVPGNFTTTNNPITAIAVGTYTVVTDPNNGCTASSTVQVTQNHKCSCGSNDILQPNLLVQQQVLVYCYIRPNIHLCLEYGRGNIAIDGNEATAAPYC